MALSWLAVRPHSRAALRLMTAGPVSTAVQARSRENNFAAVRNSFRIDGAMPGAKSSAGTGEFGALTCPVTGDARQDRPPARGSGRCQQ